MGKVLVIEDEQHMQRLIEVILKKEGHSLLKASSGEKALELLREHTGDSKPDLILLDIMLTGIDGLQVLKAIKSNAELKDIPVVMLTTSTRDQDIARSYDGGACSFVTKPVSFEKLKEVIKHFALYWTLVSVVPPTRTADGD